VIRLIVGLGNPGSQYQKTRHNAGFLFLDYLAEVGLSSWAVESKFHGVVSSCQIAGKKVILLKPQTFMNKSGLAVGAVARYYKIKPEEILVAHDELDLDSGVVRFKMGGGHAGHNGLRDIIQSLGEKNFYRLRFGIGRPSVGKKVADFVLSGSSKQEAEDLLFSFAEAESTMSLVVLGEMAKAMNGLNTK